MNILQDNVNPLVFWIVLPIPGGSLQAMRCIQGPYILFALLLMEDWQNERGKRESID